MGRMVGDGGGMSGGEREGMGRGFPDQSTNKVRGKWRPNTWVPWVPGA